MMMMMMMIEDDDDIDDDDDDDDDSFIHSMTRLRLFIDHSIHSFCCGMHHQCRILVLVVFPPEVPSTNAS